MLLFVPVFIFANVITLFITILIHIIYERGYKQEDFIRVFTNIHFLVNYFYGALSVIYASSETMFKGLKVPHFLSKEDGSWNYWLMVFFIALSNKEIYKTFQIDLESSINKLTQKLKPTVIIFNKIILFLKKIGWYLVMLVLYYLRILLLNIFKGLFFYIRSTLLIIYLFTLLLKVKIRRRKSQIGSN